MNAAASLPRRPPARGPSTWRHRLPLVALALAGAGVAGYLAAFQLGLVATVWEPLFGDGSRRVLTSGIARALPVPDAALGVAGFLLEAVLGLAGGPERWREQPRLVLAFGAVVAAMALGSLALVAVQVVWFGTGCTLCLVSAAISLGLAAGARGEVAAAIDAGRQPVGPRGAA